MGWALHVCTSVVDMLLISMSRVWQASCHCVCDKWLLIYRVLMRELICKELFSKNFVLKCSMLFFGMGLSIRMFSLSMVKGTRLISVLFGM